MYNTYIHNLHALLIIHSNNHIHFQGMWTARRGHGCFIGRPYIDDRDKTGIKRTDDRTFASIFIEVDTACNSKPASVTIREELVKGGNF